MKELHFSMQINAPKQKVWETMLNKDSYVVWTQVFNPSGSTYEGSWDQGSSIRFIGPEEDGKPSGMLSKIKENRKYEFLSIQHIGELNKGVEKMYEPGAEAYENYTFNEKDGGTEVLVDMTSAQDFPKEYEEMFQTMWPQALQKLKELAEQ
jgi:uncharacterized protein YndB with AHSA1/START domain